MKLHLSIAWNLKGKILIGYWYSKYEKIYPKCIPSKNKNWTEDVKRNFLYRLSLLVPLNTYYYKGWSDCRICERKNGSSEFLFGKYIVPSGYRHYIEKHNIEPPLYFYLYVINSTKAREYLKVYEKEYLKTKGG